MQRNIHEEVNKILAGMESTAGEDEQEQSVPSIDEPEPIQDIYVLIVREHEEDEPDQPQDGAVETTLVQQRPSPLLFIAVCFFALLLPVASITLQVYLMLNPFTATITILPKSQQLSFNGSVQLGRTLAPITLSQTRTTPTTGKGHQDAKAATGFITFYNGQFQTITIAAGTILTGSDGMRIVTDQPAYIPAASLNPPVFGQVSISAHAINPGASGNIQAYDINQTCCATSILIKNTSSFYGGVDARDFQAVAKGDIDTTAAPLKISLTQRLKTALQGEVQTGEILITPTCTPTTTADHQAGEEASLVKVTVSDTCSGAIAYKRDGLQKAVTQLLSTQALKKLGNGYTLFGSFQIAITQVTPTKPVVLSFLSRSVWVYGLNTKMEERVKQSIAGKTKQEAMQILKSLPGIKSASIQWDENMKLPKDTRNIHLIVPNGRS